MDTDKESRYIGVAEIAQELGVSRMTVYRAIHNGELPALQFRRSYRVDRRAYEEWRKGMTYRPSGKSEKRD